MFKIEYLKYTKEQLTMDINSVLDEIAPNNKDNLDFTGGYIQQMKNSNQLVAFFGTKEGTNNRDTVKIKISHDELDLFYLMLKAKIHEIQNKDTKTVFISMADRKLKSVDLEDKKPKPVVKKEFTFSLDKARLLSSTSKEYQTKLKDYITLKGGLSYEDFYNQCEMKPYRYKNYKMAFDKWNKSTVESKPKSFKQQDAEKTNDSIDAFLNAREEGFDLRNLGSKQSEEVIETEILTNEIK